MAIQNITLKQITSTTSLSSLDNISVLNSSASATITVSSDGGSNTVTLKTGESISLQSSSGYSLPTITITLGAESTVELMYN
jgi:hypothetical protein